MQQEMVLVEGLVTSLFAQIQHQAETLKGCRREIVRLTESEQRHELARAAAEAERAEAQLQVEIGRDAAVQLHTDMDDWEELEAPSPDELQQAVRRVDPEARVTLAHTMQARTPYPLRNPPFLPNPAWAWAWAWAWA